MFASSGPCKRVVGYLRVSTEEQARHGISLDAQREKINLYCQYQDLDLVAIEVDMGLSGGTLKRPGLSSALQRLSSGEACGLVIAKLDRLTRSVLDLGQLLNGYFSEAAGMSLFSLGESIDTRTAGGRLVLFVLTTVAQWELETVKERVATTISHQRSIGGVLGTVPYGMVVDPATNKLVADAKEMETVAMILKLHSLGWSLRRIAEHLTAFGIPTKHHSRARSKNLPWSASTIRQLINRFATNATDQENPASVDPGPG
jgi:site-specific DNA recombinase